MFQPTRKPILWMATSALLALLAPALAAGEAGVPEAIADEQIAGTTLTVVPHIAYEQALLRVAGPDGYALTSQFAAGEPILADLAADREPERVRDSLQPRAEAVGGLAHPSGAAAPTPRASLTDGSYHYEVVLTGPSGQRRAQTGRLYAEGGALVRHTARQAGGDGLRATSAGEREATIADGAREPVLDVDDVLNILDTNADNLSRLTIANPLNGNWHLENQSGVLFFHNVLGDGLVDLAVLPDSRFGIGTAAPVNALHVDDDFGLQIRLSDGVSAHRLDSFEGTFSIGIPDQSFQFRIRNNANNNTLVLGGSGVGIGTSQPNADLDIRNITGSANTAIRVTNGDHAWVNGVRPDGNFIFNKLGSGGSEFTVRERDHADSTLDVQGHVRGTSFKSSSSQALKTAFEAIDPIGVLAKLAALPVTAWRYKTESDGKRHIGPVAEDFQRLFGLGDGKTIATVDADGVLMAAVQGLVQKLEQALSAKDAEIATLTTANTELAQRVEALERRP